MRASSSKLATLNPAEGSGNCNASNYSQCGALTDGEPTPKNASERGEVQGEGGGGGGLGGESGAGGGSSNNCNLNCNSTDATLKRSATSDSPTSKRRRDELLAKILGPTPSLEVVNEGQGADEYYASLENG